MWCSKMMRAIKGNIVLIALLSMIVLMFPAQTLATNADSKQEMSVAEPIAVEAMTDKPENPALEILEPLTQTEKEYTEVTSDELEETASLLADTLTYGNLQYTVSGNNITITGCSESATSLNIPTQIDGKNVTAIANNAFNGRNSLKSLTIPNGVTSLGIYMIQGTAIKSITIPSTVVSAGDVYNGNFYSYRGALAGCATLEEVIFADGMTKIPDYVCAGYNPACPIKRVSIPESVKTIGTYSLTVFTGLATLRIVSGTRTIITSKYSTIISIIVLYFKCFREHFDNNIFTKRLLCPSLRR